MALAFSTPAEGTFQQKPVTEDELCVLPEEWEEFMELPRCSSWILAGGYRKVALQFPDSCLKRAAAVAQALSKTTSSEVFVLADTSYGSCCIDEVAALHYQADAIIHFGHSCLSPSDRLPVLSIFGKGSIDITDCVDKLISLVPDKDAKILVISAVEYEHAVEQMQQRLENYYSDVVLPKVHEQHVVDQPVKVPSQAEDVSSQSQEASLDHVKCSLNDDKSIFKIFGRCYSLTNRDKIKNYNVLYVGEESVFLTNLMLTCRDTTFYSYSPRERICLRQNISVNKMLMKRFYMVEKVKDAQVVGILVATLSVARYMEIVHRLKSLLTHAGKKYYVFSVGKINVPKLANFPDVDVFVLVSCPESIILDSSEYYSPIVTPYEVELACSMDREWTGDIVLDYTNLLPGGDSYHETDWDKPMLSTDVSLITGGVRRLGVDANTDNDSAGSKAVVSRDPLALTAVSGELFSSHSWKGLDPKLGQTEVTKAVQGRKGIAIHYEEEPS